MKAETFLLVAMGLLIYLIVGLAFLTLMYIGTATRQDIGNSTCYHVMESDSLNITTCMSGPIKDDLIAPYGHH